MCFDGYWRHSFGFAHFEGPRSGFIALLPTSISADLDIVGQFDVICEVGFHPVFRILALRRSLQVNWASYVDIE